MLASPPDTKTRAALLRHLIAKLQPLFAERDLRVDLGRWLAKLSTSDIAECLELDAAATAAALSTALLEDDGTTPIDAQLADLAAVEFPRLTADGARKVAAFAATVRRLAVEGDGTVGAGALMAEGYGHARIDAWMPIAKRLLAVLGGAARRQPHPHQSGATPAACLARAGELSARRMAA